MHGTNTSSPNRTAPLTAPAITVPVGTPVLSGVVCRVGVGVVVLPVVSSVSVGASGPVIARLVMTT